MKNKSKRLIFADWTNLRASFLQNSESCSQFGALQWKTIFCWRDCKVQMQVSSYGHTEHYDVTILMVRSGYMMSGSPVSWCQSDGSWAPKWSQVSCIRYSFVFLILKIYSQSPGLVRILELSSMGQLTRSGFITKFHKQSPTNVQR